MMSSHSPPVSTPLEACRVAPYVNMPAMRSSTGPTSSGSAMNSSGSAAAAAAMHHHHQATFGGNGSAAAAAAAAAAAFSAFDPALLSAAHQVSNSRRICLELM